MVGVVLQGKWLVDSNIVTFFQPYKRDVFFWDDSSSIFSGWGKTWFYSAIKVKIGHDWPCHEIFFWIIPLLSNWAKESHFSKGGHLQNLPTRVLSHDSWDDPPDVCESSFDILSQTGSKTISWHMQLQLFSYVYYILYIYMYYYIILYYTIFYFIMLYYIILFFILLYCIILYSIVLYYIVCGLMLCVPTPTLNGMGPQVARPARLFKSYF